MTDPSLGWATIAAAIADAAAKRKALKEDPNYELEYYRSTLLNGYSDKDLRAHLIHFGAYPQAVNYLPRDSLVGLILNPNNATNRRLFVWGGGMSTSLLDGLGGPDDISYQPYEPDIDDDMLGIGPGSFINLTKGDKHALFTSPGVRDTQIKALLRQLELARLQNAGPAGMRQQRVAPRDIVSDIELGPYDTSTDPNPFLTTVGNAAYRSMHEDPDPEPRLRRELRSARSRSPYENLI